MISGNVMRATFCPKIFEELIKTTTKFIIGGKYPSEQTKNRLPKHEAKLRTLHRMNLTRLQDCNTL
jgi:hypothetical protein